ncbi:GntR family transcriptional regulator [Serinibacter salmoneus]|uniref:GntR family transcriptional regulator n=1 Tax=Serinibacter salmoneus TaxID=556530 RepID=A0A2A9D0J2_9MICO|nr:GntR family transcriptional regulator [Serinibacter salmoneus]PFG19906.1 GntR family transcriptional regulator [Serinibacter salmoneus]
MGDSEILDGPRPKHAQLADSLAAKVTHWESHTAIPSERELMATYGVSRATVREALRSLVEDGLLYRVHGKGTFVAPQRVETQLHLASFTDDMRRRGLLASTILQGAHLVTPPVEARAALGLGDGDQAWRVDRLRLAGGSPMAVERGYYPAALLPGLSEHDLSASLYEILAGHYGLAIDAAEQTVWAQACEGEIARDLTIAAGDPVMVFRRTSRSGQVAVEYVTSWYRGDRYQVHMALTR